ncbi:MAG: hypothetical protein ACE14L_08485 [Terriglobales bacterium]
MAVNNSGYATWPGGGAFWAPDASAGVIAFVPASPNPAGATNATGNNEVGASDSTIGHVPGLSFASTDMPVYMRPELIAGLPQFMGEPEDLAAFISPRRLRLGPIRFDSAYTSAPPPPGVATLAEVARSVRERKATPRNIRTYTNTDLVRVQNAPVSTATIRPYQPGGGAAQANFDRNVGYRTRRPVPSAPPIMTVPERLPAPEQPGASRPAERGTPLPLQH